MPSLNTVSASWAARPNIIQQYWDAVSDDDNNNDNNKNRNLINISFSWSEYVREAHIYTLSAKSSGSTQWKEQQGVRIIMAPLSGFIHR